jgi:mono/diheme cytochrome c family protein
MTNSKYMARGRPLFIVALGTIIGIWFTLLGPASAADADAGKQIFQEKCVACHTVGGGDLIGPDLMGVTTKRPRDWLEQWIAAPDAMLAKKDPVAIELLHKYRDVPMPNPGLGAADVTAILAYLETASGQPSATPSTASAPEVQGNPEIGKELFTGVLRFRNGGPPCMACHSAAGIGALGGGQLGPDLTDVVTRMGGAAAVNAWLSGMPTPTMKAVWSQHPPIPEERASVVSFLGQAQVTQRPAQAIWQLAALAGLGLVVLLAMAAFNWRNRLRFGVRRPMVAKLTTGATSPRNGGWFTGPYHPGWKSQFKSD